jgi:hypothetical protein
MIDSDYFRDNDLCDRKIKTGNKDLYSKVRVSNGPAFPFLHM